MKEAAPRGIRVPCVACPLRALHTFRDFTPDELAFVQEFKRSELRVQRGDTVLAEGEASAHFYTVLSGWGFRYKMLEDGRRQIVNYVMPGDLIGLQGTLMGEMQHSVEALSAMTLCVFERERLFRLYEQHPSLAYDVTWIASREECMLDENLLAVGRRSASESAAYLIALLTHRAETTRLSTGGRLALTQQHVADTLGLSLVHTNRTLRGLVAMGLIDWSEGGFVVLARDRLISLARWKGADRGPRPFI